MTRLARRLKPPPGAPRIAGVLAIETPRLVLRAQPPAVAGTVILDILLKPGFTEAGWVEFKLQDGPDMAAALHFFLAPPYRGRGLMREALRAAAPRAIRLLGASALRATVPADACAAEAALRSIGLSESWRRGAVKRFEKDLCVLF